MNFACQLKKGDTIVITLFSCAIVWFSVSAWKQNDKNQLTMQLAAKGRYNAVPIDVIGKNAKFRGSPTAPFTLVEFG